jgi:hypothetical protein
MPSDSCCGGVFTELASSLPCLTRVLADVTVTVARDGGHLPDPAAFAIGAQQAASGKGASIISAHTAEQIISTVTVEVADRPAAVAVALAVVSEALRRPAVSSSR